MNERNSSLIFLLAALALVPLMPSGDSIWIDEAQTWRYARHASVAEVWQEFRNDKFSEAQMPLGMAAAWAWARILVTSEWALRAPNMVYAAGSILCFYLIGRRERIPWMPLFMAIQPFLWFYVNEARPYALQIFGGSLLLLALYKVYRGHLSTANWAILWAVGSFVSSASSMLGAIPTLAITVAIGAELLRRRHSPNRFQSLALATGAFSLLGLGSYYLSTLLKGAGGAKIWNVGAQNLLFSAVEFLGFAGLLPARHELRSTVRLGFSSPDDLSGLFALAIPPTIMLLLLVAVAITWVRNLRETPRWVVACAAVVGVSAGLLLIASMAASFPFWGRHLAAAFPAFAAAACWVVSLSWASGSIFPRYSALALTATLAVSSLMLRFSSIHVRDDYRYASKLGIEEASKGQIVWWAADPSAASYYGLQVLSGTGVTRLHPQASKVYLVSIMSSAERDLLPRPHLIVISKPDSYDTAGTLRSFIVANNYELIGKSAAFSIFRGTP
jgi:MFS family permease